MTNLYASQLYFIYLFILLQSVARMRYPKRGECILFAILYHIIKGKDFFYVCRKVFGL